jgi:hypothetical protein
MTTTSVLRALFIDRPGPVWESMPSQVKGAVCILEEKGGPLQVKAVTVEHCIFDLALQKGKRACIRRNWKNKIFVRLSG